MTRTTMATAVLAVSLAVPALAADDFHWRGTVDKGAAVEVKGVNGAIRASAASGSQVEVTAVKRARRDDPAQVEIKVVEHAGGVTICALYPSRAGQAPNVCAPGGQGHVGANDNDVSVDFTLKVPAGVRMVARTVNGSVEARGIGADADLATVNGSVDVEAAGAARARTVNGRISARLGRAEWQGTLALETVNGSIEIALPERASAEVSGSTVHGEIETDFPLAVSGRHVGRRLHGTIGSGGRRLELKTVNGSIEVRKTRAS